MNRDAWNRRYAARRSPWASAPHPLVVTCLQGLTPATAMDAGCGDGRHACWLQAQGWTVTAVDYAELAIERARQRCAGVDWLVADLAHWSPAERSLDLVLVSYLHTGATERALWMQGLREAVRPGGHFLYLGHAPENLTHGHGGPQDPDLLPSVDAVRRALPGFEPLRAEVVERRGGDDPGHGAPATATVVDALVLAVRRV